jgi:SAM-dependent methyltransferase/glycosyltransferase involved in cell wall biosynthesis
MGEIFWLKRPERPLPFTGERFTSAESGQIEIEHVHRYALARHFCRGRDVLDVASGEGYGSALLGQVARSVIGVDVSEDAVAHATHNYGRQNLSFLQGVAEQLPLADASVDVVVSFETIEHLYDHAQFLAEIRRVLRESGTLILSTPDRDIYSPPDQPSNPHHVRELTRREFHALLQQSFLCTRFFSQRAMLGSAILADEALPRAELPLVFEQRGEEQIESSRGLARATYLICIASNAETPAIPESLFVYRSGVQKFFSTIRDLHAELQRERASSIRVEHERQTVLERASRESAILKEAIKERNLKLSEFDAKLGQAYRERDAAISALVEADNHRSVLNAAVREIESKLFQVEEQCDALGLAVHKLYQKLTALRGQDLFQFLRKLPGRRKRVRRIVEAIRRSQLFDGTWYLTQYPDVRDRGLDPAFHYARFGHQEGRDPGPAFSTINYICKYPDIVVADYNALEHYELFGRAEGREITMGSEHEEPNHIQVRNGRSPPASLRMRQALQTVRASPLFDANWYLSRYQDVREGGTDPAVHYVCYGAAEGRDPGPGFSTRYYVELYSDVLTQEYNPLEHYELHGRVEGRRPIPQSAWRDFLTEEKSYRRARSVESPDALRIVFVSGEPHTAGHVYRVERYAAAARALGAEALVKTVGEAASVLEAIEAANLLVIWRAEWSDAIERIVGAAKEVGIRIIFDVDDLMFDPSLALVTIIDGIRSQSLTEDEVRDCYLRILMTMQAADFCSCPTPFLAGQARRWRKPTFVLPNGFDEATWHAARLAVRLRNKRGTDGLVRIGYAGGTRTHQRDFGLIARVVARVLSERPECRLVLFRRETVNCLDLDEFPELVCVSSMVEWRELVPVHELPCELARFDINLAPLEVGNVFCESKSELKFFEAALVGVPSICSPTSAYSAAVRNGETGILAQTEEEWYSAIVTLLDNPPLRERMTRAAYYDVLWRFGPERRAELLQSVLDQAMQTDRRAARAFELEWSRAHGPHAKLPVIPDSETILCSDMEGKAEVTVIVPVYNYGTYLTEALDSVDHQSLAIVDIVVIDDCSTDDSLEVAHSWLSRHLARFNRAMLMRNRTNVGLALTRNVGFAAAETRFVLQLDADNKLLPDCASRCLEAIEATGAAFVYPTLQQFGDAEALFCEKPYDTALLAGGNYIDAMALVRLSAWAAVGGYDHIPFGWEDYDLWCKFAERGLYGHHLEEVLALYRVHNASMLKTVTDIDANKRRLIAEMRERHPWILEGLDLAPGK